MFHGFIFTFRPNSTKETLQLEAEYIQSLVSQSIKNDSLTISVESMAPSFCVPMWQIVGRILSWSFAKNPAIQENVLLELTKTFAFTKVAKSFKSSEF